MEARRISAGCTALVCAVLVAFSVYLGSASNVNADQYDPLEAGHPLRIAAYIAHPVGVIFDYVLMRPAFWIVQHEPFKTIFGYESYTKGVETQ